MEMKSCEKKKEELAEEHLMVEVSKQGVHELQKKSYEYMKLMSYYRCAIKEVETKFDVLNEEYSIQFDRNPINSIQTRLKSLSSIIQKMEKYNLPLSVEGIEERLSDIAGVRVICAFQEDVYSLARALLKQDDIVLIKEKDYIKKPKANGYRSLHLIVSVPIFLAEEKKIMKVEIQLRTIAMDSWASLEHQLRYKKDIEITPEISDNLLKCAELSAELDERMNKLREQIFR